MPACFFGWFSFLCIELLLISWAPARPPQAPPWSGMYSCMTCPRRGLWAVWVPRVFVGLVVDFSFSWRAFLTQRFSRECEAVMALHEAVQHGIGHRLVTYPFVPMLDG